jgi:nitrite reductase (NADH) large subunit
MLKPGVFVFRTIDDCERMRASARPAGNAIVLGGGLLGLEAAKGLADYGMHVTVIHLFDVLMNAQLDKLAGEFLRRAIEKLGIFVQTGRSVKEVVGTKRVEGVRFEGGSTLPADLVVLATGIKPRIDLAIDSDIPTNMGILVNDRLATAIPGIYALGECAEHNGKVYGLVQPIWEQCAVLADQLTGANVKSRYTGSKLHTRLKVAGVEVTSMGVNEAKQPSDETIQIIEEHRDAYRKLIVRDDRLIGAILVGDTSSAGTLVQLFERGDLLPANRLDLFASGEASAVLSDPEICNCHHVKQSTLEECIASGKRSLLELAQATQAGTGCGSCRGQLTNLILKNGPKVNSN